jgi:hypothetical protein
MLPRMTGVTIPRSVRIAALFVWLLLPAGLLLVLDGLWELHWWGTSSAGHLHDLLRTIQEKYGNEPPILLRGKGGAVELVVLGAIVMAIGCLAPQIRQGWRTARTLVLLFSIGTAGIGLAFIGGDLSVPIDLHGYLVSLRQGTAVDYVRQVEALVYPGWYPWVEDIAQGLQVIASLAAVVALGLATMSDGDFFTAKGKDQGPPDEWDDAISRLHKKTVGEPENH